MATGRGGRGFAGAGGGIRRRGAAWGRAGLALPGRYLRRLVPAPIAAADLALFRRVAGLHAPPLDAVLPRLSTAANHSRLWMAIAALLAARGDRFGRRAALRALLSLGMTSALANQPGKLLTGRARPDLDVVPIARRLARVPTSTSFPSGHSASAAAFAVAVGMEIPRARWPLGVLAGAVAFSRVYTGVHYPGDVLAGVALGAGVAGASRRVWPLADRAPARGGRAAGVTGPGADGEGLVIVVNNQAGQALLPGPAARLRRGLPGAQVVEVDDAEGLQKALQEASGRARALGIAGGDGSVRTAAGVAQSRGLPLLVVPSGTLNHLAMELGLADVGAAVDAVRDGEIISAELAEIDGRPFVNAASVGVYPHLVDAREDLETRFGKWPAVVLGMVRTLRHADPVELELDGRPRRIWLLFIGNCTYRAPGIAPTHRTELDDGLFDVRILDADRRWSRARVLVSALYGRRGTSGPYERTRQPQLRIRPLDGTVRLACDGETFDGSPDIAVRKRPEPLLLLVPRTDEAPGDLS